MTIIRQGTIKRIHVNRHRVRAGRPKPISIQTSKGVRRADHVSILGRSHVVYSPEKPLHCGAKLWVETHAGVRYE